MKTYDPVNDRMFVTNALDNTVSVIDTNTNMVIGSPIPVGEEPSSIAYDPVHHRMYVTNVGEDDDSNIISVINLCPRPQLQ
jgi:YVTN family beta-propeller protein